MKKTLIWLLLTVMALSCCGNALASGFVLPTPESATPTPAPEPDNGGRFDINPTQAPKLLVLPSPSYFFTVTPTFTESFFQTGELVYDAQIYPISDAGNTISEYLTACQEEGFVWDISDAFVGYVAYSITDGVHTAYMIPYYGDQLLLLTPQGMLVQEAKAAPQAYEKDKLLLTVNGVACQLDFNKDFALGYYNSRVYIPLDFQLINYGFNLVGTTGYFKGTNFIFSSTVTPYQLVIVTVPDNVRTAVRYHADIANLNGLSCVILKDASLNKIWEGYFRATISSESTPLARIISASEIRGEIMNSLEVSVTVKQGLDSDKDYFDITIIFVNGNEYKGTFEGVFNNGKDTVTGTFWVVK